MEDFQKVDMVHAKLAMLRTYILTTQLYLVVITATAWNALMLSDPLEFLAALYVELISPKLSKFTIKFNQMNYIWQK